MSTENQKGKQMKTFANCFALVDKIRNMTRTCFQSKRSKEAKAYLPEGWQQTQEKLLLWQQMTDNLKVLLHLAP